MTSVVLPPLSTHTMPHETTPPPSPNQHLTLNTSIRGTPTPLPNKHLPFCSPGPTPAHGLISPPQSPQSPVETTTSLLYPASHFKTVSSGDAIYSIDASTLSKALDHLASQPLPDPKLVFPWMHGLHPDNHFQHNFFDSHRPSSQRVPQCLRGITIVKVGGDLTKSKLKGAISPEELLYPRSSCKTKAHSKHCKGGPCFIDIDPKTGFGIRNFQIQACKMATVSDLVVYGDDQTPQSEVTELAVLLHKAQATWSLRPDVGRTSREPKFNTFVLSESFSSITQSHPELVAIDDKAILNPDIMDFCRQERLEMCALSSASEIAHNVYLGPSPDPTIVESLPTAMKDLKFDVLVEASDFANLPDTKVLTTVERFLSSKAGKSVTGQMQFPSSGSIASPDSSKDATDPLDGLLEMCQWMQRLANAGADHSTTPTTPRRFFIHCADGYTETSLLALAYLMFANNLSAHAAWATLHTKYSRNFFAYTADKTLLKRFQEKLLTSVPAYAALPENAIAARPIWMGKMDGSLPSRILPYLYLGNLLHANNPGLLRNLNIKRVLSVGEPINWRTTDLSSSGESVEDWPESNFLYVDKVQDNGLDPLVGEFERCLSFIEEGKRRGEATLVHCRVGVSRSATICIAEVMKERELSFPRAYCFVRARRLNVIIQPHLRFTYELLKWDETLSERRGVPLKREFEWATVAREIAAMNKPYCRV